MLFRSLAKHAGATVISTASSDEKLERLKEFGLDQGINYAKYYVGSREGIWERGDESPTNLGYKVRLKEGYFPTPPMDTMQNIRSEMVTELNGPARTFTLTA